MISEFKGEYRFLSNFWYFNGDKGPTTVEHHYQAAKANNEFDAQWVLSSPSPQRAKKRGREIEMRQDWDAIKYDFMLDIVRWKFRIDPELGDKLLATGNQELQEGNTWGDTVWGVDLRTGVGSNLLGHVLMQVREELKDERY